MAGNSAIWRATAESSQKGPEPNGGGADKIEFDLDAAVPDNTGHIGNTQFEIVTGIAENEAPFKDVNELQFTGVATVTITIVGHVQLPDSTKVPWVLKQWELEPQNNGSFTRGRFGLRLNDFPVFNLTPYAADSGTPRGYAIESVKCSRADMRGRIDFSIVLRFSGDKGSAATNPPYNWI